MSKDRRLPTPPNDPVGIVEWVGEHFAGLYEGELDRSSRFVGGQTSADAALAAFGVSGYARQRNEVQPLEARGASQLSPYIRHNLLPLRRVWDSVEGGPSRDVSKFRFELAWQEYARHWYAVHGSATTGGIRYEQFAASSTEAWRQDMECVAVNLDELHSDGWVVNQARMWLASQWAVRHDARWQDGENHFFRHLLDGSRAANRLGWQWTAGLSKQKAYGFSRRQVLNRAPGLCDRCRLKDDCPIGDWPAPPDRMPVQATVATPPNAEAAGPRTPIVRTKPEAVWLTAESMGDGDPASVTNPDLPIVFVFDVPLLNRLQLSAKRIVFMAETLADLEGRRDVEVWLGSPRRVLEGRAVAATFAPVPGFRRLLANVGPLAELHPYPWLRYPDGGSVSSFTAWNRRTDA